MPSNSSSASIRDAAAARLNPSTLSLLLASRPNLRKIVLAEMTAGEHLTSWVLSSGQTHTYDSGTSNRVIGVNENGVALTARTSIALTESNAGSYYWDQAAGRVYYHPTGAGTPAAYTVQATAQFLMSTEGRVIDGKYYEGRISSLPNLSMRVEQTFGDPGQIGGGNLEFNNLDGYFDALVDLQWDAGQVDLKMGADDPGNPGVDCAYSDYSTVGRWLVRTWDKTDKSFKMKLEEVKSNTKLKIPLTFYAIGTYANMDADKDGNAIPIAYGKVFDVEATCIDTTTRQFKVASHAIHDLAGVRVLAEDTGIWTDVTPTSEDLANAQFILGVSDWVVGQKVAVDLEGKEIGGDLNENPSDIVRDLLVTYQGVDTSELHWTSFAASVTSLAGRGRLAIYIDKPEEIFDVVAKINETVGSYLFTDFDGKYRYVVFEAVAGASVMSFNDSEIFSFSDQTTATNIISKVRAEYQYRTMQDYSQVVFYEATQYQYLRRAATPVLKELEKLPLSVSADALDAAQRAAIEYGHRRRSYKVRVSHKGWTLLPTDMVQLTSSRHGVNDVYEVVEVKRDLATGQVDLVLGDQHGLRGATLATSGFWTADAPVFPAAYSGETGYGTGAATPWTSGWSETLKSWARQNLGYWTDASGFADPADSDSYNVSIWT